MLPQQVPHAPVTGAVNFYVDFCLVSSVWCFSSASASSSSVAAGHLPVCCGPAAAVLAACSAVGVLLLFPPAVGAAAVFAFVALVVVGVEVVC